MKIEESELLSVDDIISCRHATLDDIDDIYQITQEAFTQYAKTNGNFMIAALSETKEDVEVELEEKAIFIVENETEVLGTARCSILVDDTEQIIGYLSRFAVKPEAQKHGVGRILLKKIISFSDQADCKALCLHTSSKAFDLARFYYRNDFFIHSITTDRDYYRALFVHEFDATNGIYDYTSLLSNL